MALSLLNTCKDARGYHPDALCQTIIYDANVTLTALGCTRNNLWSGSLPTSASFLDFGPFTHVKGEGIPIDMGAFVCRGFLEAVFLSFVDHHKAHTSLHGLTRDAVKQLRAECTLVSVEAKKNKEGPRLPHSNPAKLRACSAPAYRLYVPLWACIAQGGVAIPKLPSSKTWFYEGVYWKKDHGFKLAVGSLPPQQVAAMTNDAFEHLSQLMKTECELNKALSEVDNTPELGDDTGSRHESSPKRVKVIPSELPLDGATQVALMVELNKMHGLGTRTEAENEVRRVGLSR